MDIALKYCWDCFDQNDARGDGNYCTSQQIGGALPDRIFRCTLSQNELFDASDFVKPLLNKLLISKASSDFTTFLCCSVISDSGTQLMIIVFPGSPTTLKLQIALNELFY